MKNKEKVVSVKIITLIMPIKYIMPASDQFNSQTVILKEKKKKKKSLEFLPWGNNSYQENLIFAPCALRPELSGSILFSRESSQTRNQTWVSHIAVRFSAIWAIKEAPYLI